MHPICMEMEGLTMGTDGSVINVYLTFSFGLSLVPSSFCTYEARLFKCYMLHMENNEKTHLWLSCDRIDRKHFLVLDRNQAFSSSFSVFRARRAGCKKESQLDLGYIVDILRKFEIHFRRDRVSLWDKPEDS